MLKLARYIKKYTGVILLILVLLVIQANCDLSLPGYTSDIVNVGIQQNLFSPKGRLGAGGRKCRWAYYLEHVQSCLHCRGWGG